MAAAVAVAGSAEVGVEAVVFRGVAASSGRLAAAHATLAAPASAGATLAAPASADRVSIAVRALIGPASPDLLAVVLCRRRAPVTSNDRAPDRGPISNRRAAPPNCHPQIGLLLAPALDRLSCPQVERGVRILERRAAPRNYPPDPANRTWGTFWASARVLARVRASPSCLPGPEGQVDQAPGSFRPAAPVPGSPAVRAPVRERASPTGPRSFRRSGRIGTRGARAATRDGIRRSTIAVSIGITGPVSARIK